MQQQNQHSSLTVKWRISPRNVRKHNLKLSNTCFKHKMAHTVTWQAADRPNTTTEMALPEEIHQKPGRLHYNQK